MDALNGFDRSVIQVDEDGWWFWDEVGNERYGPFETWDECVEELMRYARSLDGN